MDLSKAFDTISHDLLIAKLHAYGFDKTALKFMKSYLSNRWQRTKINSSFSTWAELIIGVPQGSVLGTCLFNIFINDLFFIFEYTVICNYADDNTIYSSDLKLDILMKKLKCSVQGSLDWFENKGMKLNSSKCHLLVCGHKYECMLCDVGHLKVIEEHKVKLLGVWIDSDLSFDDHINNICRNAAKKLNALTRQCAILPFYRRKILMNAFFNSQFSHCPLVWMSHSRSINTKINNLHFRSLRMIYNDANASFQELLFRDKSVTIHQRNLQFLAIEMFKVARGMSPDFMNEVFPLNHNLNTDNISARTRLHPQFYNPLCPRKVLSGLWALRTLGPK